MRLETKLLLFALMAHGASAYAQSAPLNVIDILIAPSAAELDWTSPGALYSTVKKSQSANNGSQTSFGHGMFVADCENLEGKRFTLSSSIGSYNYQKKARNSIIFKQEGLRVLFEDLADATLVESAANNAYLRNFYRYVKSPTTPLQGEKLRARLLRIHVSPKQCSEAQKYVRVAKESRNLKFGFGSDPFEQYRTTGKIQGAGCTSFVSGIIKAVGAWDQTMEAQFMNQVTMSEDWIGGKEKNVRLLKKLRGEQKMSWITAGIPTKVFRFYDPEKMWDFLDSAGSCLSSEEAHKNECSPAAAAWTKSLGASPSKAESRGIIFPGIEIKAP